eukprot:GEMP01006230.1.p1 GENE.GEMP01006230.1~~GEMP01006230.1.p1  ORF type:complete len:403 (+),score=92.92 GEMP01006230.1:222-1430(+)
MISTPMVNRWNDFDPLEEVVLGSADDACFPPTEPACHPEFNDQYTKYGVQMKHPFSEYVPWPTGPKLKKFIDDANEEMDGMRDTMEGEGVIVRRPDELKCNFNVMTKTPDFKSENQYCCVCPRDVIITVGNEILEAPMSKRSRYFEFRPFRSLIQHYFDNDPQMIWSAAPRPMLGDDSYCPGFWEWDTETRTRRMHEHQYCLSEKEVLFDAADLELIGDMMFVQQSMLTNLRGIRWAKRHFAQRGITVQTLHFPYDLFPSHIDCSFLALRPGMVLTNPERPTVAEEVKIFKQNDWRFVNAPKWDGSQEHPVLCQSSRWLSMNIFSITHNKVIVEEGEKELISMLEGEYGFDVLGVPYRRVFEFGGSLHCSTWDVRRRGGMKNYFPNREDITDIGMEKYTNLP